MSSIAEPARAGAESAWRGIGLRQIRMICGVIMFAYIVSHFLNHALGNISMDALAQGVALHVAFWRLLPIAIIFYMAVAIHGGLGLWALYERRHFRFKAMEPLQLALGLSIPLLIVGHVIGVRLAQVIYDHDKLYPQVFFAYWVVWPGRGWLTTLALLTSWTHGCIGLYYWLRLRDGFTRAAPVLLALAVLIPALALLGLYQGGRTVIDQSTSREWQAANLSRAKVGTSADQVILDDITIGVVVGYLGSIALVLGARGIRAIAQRRGGTVRLSYGQGPTVRIPKGVSVLEASLRNNIPHASICGGRARCSTCRIRVAGDCSALPAPSSREAFVLARVGVGTDPAVRLACQLRPTTDIAFSQLFAPTITAEELGKLTPRRAGQERYLVSMFVDMRGSTKLAETRLPFDTVFIVNRFLGAVSQAVIDCGGQPNQFVGDGQLALFGLDADPATACRQALRAAAAIAANVDELNHFLAHDLREPIRFGIGIHAGEVIIGDIGYREHMAFTALGDPVNVAARLQDMTKALACEVVISDEVRKTAGLADDGLPSERIDIRGRAGAMTVRVVTHAADLTDIITTRSV